MLGEEPEVAVRAREDQFLLPDIPLEGRQVFLVTNLVSLKVPLVGVLGVAQLTGIAALLSFYRWFLMFSSLTLNYMSDTVKTSFVSL